MAPDPIFLERARSINWTSYHGACGIPTDRVSALLIQLVTGASEDSRAAADALWNVLSHQGNVDEVAVPALPFLLEALDAVPGSVVVEVMDILSCFAACVERHRLNPPLMGREPDWISELRAGLISARSRFLPLAANGSEDVVGFAEDVLNVERFEQPDSGELRFRR